MSTEKPSRNEDEYFARQEAELLEKRRTAADETTAASERASHYMKCPKCGHDLKTSEIEDVQIDACPHCGGIWLDQGELDILMKKEDKSILRKVFGDFTAALRSRPAK